MKPWVILPLGLALATAACGSTDTERAATGGGIGAVAGAVVGGPVGALVGAAGGAAAGTFRDEGEQAVRERLDRNQAETGTQTGRRTRQMAGTDDLTNQEVREAQEALKAMGLYEGNVDGLYGRQTQRAVAEYQRRENLPQTATLDDRLLERLRTGATAGTSQPATTGETAPVNRAPATGETAPMNRAPAPQTPAPAPATGTSPVR